MFGHARYLKYILLFYTQEDLPASIIWMVDSPIINELINKFFN